MPGRHTCLTPEVQATILGHIRDGNYACVAVEVAGINLGTYYEWLRRGEGTDKRYPSKGIYVDFAIAIRKAEAEAEVEVSARVYKKLRGPDATIADELKYLQHRWPERWGRNRNEVTGVDGGPIEQIVSLPGLNIVLAKDYSNAGKSSDTETEAEDCDT